MKKVLLLIICSFSLLAGRAQDRFFARTYTSNVLAKGSIDVELWHTSRFGHKDQFFHAQDQRAEVELGLGGNVQTAFYFNRFQKRFSEGADGTTTSNEIGFSNEWKVKLADPSINKVGVALYGEWGLKGGDEMELETKLILDKQIDKHLVAFNAVYEYEKEFGWKNRKVDSRGFEMPVEFDLGYLYNFSNSLGAGIELRNHNEITKDNGWEHSVLFGGPTINYRTERWFIIANYLPQWTNLRKTATAPFNKVLDEHERAEARIILGISL